MKNQALRCQCRKNRIYHISPDGSTLDLTAPVTLCKNENSSNRMAIVL